MSDSLFTTILKNAKYIKAREGGGEFSLYDPLPRFRRVFSLTNNFKEAMLLVQSPGFCTLALNGCEVTEDRFISATSNYDQILWYHAYNVTHLLKQGENVLCAVSGNGFYNESFQTCWEFNRAPYRDAPKLKLALLIDGVCVLSTDKNFRTAPSHITYSHLRSGEHVDMRLYEADWLTADYNDSEWAAAIEDGRPPRGKLLPCSCEGVREVESYAPISVVPLEDGCLIDFGVTVSGYVSLTVRAERAKQIVIRYAEEVDDKCEPRHNDMDIPYFYPESPFAECRMIASGGTDVFKPSFCYFGFRYVRLYGYVIRDTKDITAYFVHNDVRHSSDFESGSEILNFIYRAGIRSTLSNMFWSLTDCPTREKFGWLNDAQASVEQTLINFKILPFYKKWYTDVLTDASPEYGLHGIVPTWGWGDGWGPGCDCFLFELPYRVWLYTADSSMLCGAIDAFENYLTYLRRKILENAEFLLADWTGSNNDPRIPGAMVRDFYYLKALYITDIAYRLYNGREPYREELARAKERFFSTYLTLDGRCRIEEQSAIAMLMTPWAAGADAMLGRQLCEVVVRDGLTLTTGMVGVQYLYDALCLAGRADLAYRIITESVPGYRTWYEQGATTLWEHWDGANHGSHNHHMFSGVIAWFYKALLGIRPTEDAPGFTRLVLSPNFIREVGFIKGEFEIPYGKIKAEWFAIDGGFCYRVTIPEGVHATFNDQKLYVGENEFFIREA